MVVASVGYVAKYFHSPCFFHGASKFIGEKKSHTKSHAKHVSAPRRTAPKAGFALRHPRNSRHTPSKGQRNQRNGHGPRWTRPISIFSATNDTWGECQLSTEPKTQGRQKQRQPRQGQASGFRNLPCLIASSQTNPLHFYHETQVASFGTRKSVIKALHYLAFQPGHETTSDSDGMSHPLRPQFL
ncbi:unnamed protein product, partial [Ectocarpus fasciculatus]